MDSSGKKPHRSEPEERTDLALNPLAPVIGRRFPKRIRIHSQRDFDRLFGDGFVSVDPMLVVHTLPNSIGCSRLAISISKRVGSAPLRNRWKRMIREAYRTQRAASMNSSIDILVRPRRGAVPDQARIAQSLRNLVARAVRQSSGKR